MIIMLSYLASLKSKPSPLLTVRLHWRTAAGSKPAPSLYKPGTINLRSSAFICGSYFAKAPEIKSSPRKRIRMTRIGRIFTDFLIRVNPRHPRNPCSIAASLFADASYSDDSDRINRMDRINPSANPVNPVHPVQSSFSAAPDINYSEFIKICTSQNTSPRSHHILIHNTFIGPGNTLYIDRTKSSCARGNAYKNPEGKIWYPV